MPFSIVTAKVKLDNTGASLEMPLLVCEAGPVVPVADYCISKSRSLSWIEKVTRAAKRFLEYLAGNADTGADNWQVFRNFSLALRNGTIDKVTGSDPSGLYWLGLKEKEANATVKRLTDMFDWLSREYQTKADTYNPKYAGNDFDKRIDRLALVHKRSKSFLGHTWIPEAESRGRVTRPGRDRKRVKERPPKFPEEHFQELLFKGFVVAGKPDYRAMLIALLLHGGGVRVSEPFHIFVPDVQPGLEDPSIALVTIHHPEEGGAPYGWRNSENKPGSREQYLAAKFGLSPRNKHWRGEGWKNNAEDGDGYMQVHWFPEYYGRWFMDIWKLYLPTLASVHRDHPYAFINLQGPATGQPYKAKQFQRCFKAAVKRIGLDAKKLNGTTPHGCRHAYAQRLNDCGVSEIIIQRVMHHGSIESQKAYTAPERKQITEALRKAATNLSDSNGDVAMNNLNQYL